MRVTSRESRVLETCNEEYPIITRRSKSQLYESTVTFLGDDVSLADTYLRIVIRPHASFLLMVGYLSRGAIIIAFDPVKRRCSLARSLTRVENI